MIKKDIGNILLDQLSLLDRLNKVWMPVIAEMRSRINSISGFTILTKGPTVNITTTQRIILVDATDSAITVYLPKADNIYREIIIKKIDASANDITVYPFETSFSLINGNTSLILTSITPTGRLIPYNENWYTV